jgi:hypothetical protein
MDEDDTGRMHRIVTGKADVLARRSGLDAGRVRTVLFGLLEAGWLTPRFPWHTAFDEALGALPPEDALRLFEEEDLPGLAQRAMAMQFVAHEFTPLYTRGELTDLARHCVAHLERNTESLLLTGHPKTNFARSPFFDWHLTRLNFTKIPLTLQRGRQPSSQIAAERDGVAETDHLGNLAYSYTWAREPAESLGGRILTDLGDGDAFLSLPSYRWCDGVPTTLQGDPIHACSYEDAALAPGLCREDAARLESMRRRLLGLRIDIVRRLSGASSARRAYDLEEECFARLAEALTYDDAQFLLAMDKFYEGLHGGAGFAWAPVKSMAFHNGGLGDLLDVVGHFAEEVEVGWMHWTAVSLRAAARGSRVPSYYAAVASGMRPAVDVLLDRFLELAAAGDTYLSECGTRAHDLLQNRLNEEVTVSRRVARGRSRQFRSMLETFADFLKSQVEVTGEFPKLSLSSPPETPTVAGNMFRCDGATWTVTFEGITKTFRNTKGMRYLALLLEHPNHQFAPDELVRLVNGEPDATQTAVRIVAEQEVLEGDLHPVESSTGELLTPDEIRRQIREFDQELADAERNGDPLVIAYVKNEKQKFMRTTAGRLRRGNVDQGSQAARKLVSHHVNAAIRRIGDAHPALGTHLTNAILPVGNTPCYVPGHSIVWLT